MLSQNNNQATLELSQRVRWYVGVRWFFLISLGLSGLIPEYLAHTATFGSDVLIFIGGLAYNGLFWTMSRWRKGSRNYFRALGFVQIASDILLISYLILTHGGIESRSIIVYAIPILLAGAIFDRAGTYLAAAVSAVLYDLILLGDWGHWLAITGSTYPSWHTNSGFLTTSIIFYSASLMIIAIISDYLLRLLRNRENLLAEKTEALENAQAIAQFGSWELDLFTGSISWSQEFGHIYGLSLTDRGGRRQEFLSYIHPDDRPAVTALLEQAAKNRQPFSVTSRIVRPDGVVRDLRIQAAVRGSSLRAGKIVGTVQDISDRVAAEKALDRRSQDLEKLNQLMIGRELKMIELKQENETLKAATKKAGGGLKSEGL